MGEPSPKQEERATFAVSVPTYKSPSRRDVTFVAFDLLVLDANNLCGRPYRECAGAPWFVSVSRPQARQRRASRSRDALPRDLPVQIGKKVADHRRLDMTIVSRSRHGRDNLDMPDDLNPFGYREEHGVLTVISATVGKGRNSDTFEPALLMFLTVGTHAADRLCFAMTPDNADALAAELIRWAARAREKPPE